MNIMKTIAAGVITFSCFMIACTKKFEEINTDPNRIDQISPGTLLNPIIYDAASLNMDISARINFELMQVDLPFPSTSGGIHRYDLSDNIGNNTWNTYYRIITNIKEMYAASVKAEDPNYQAIAMTLNAWIYSNLTDAFGDVPMDEAARGDEQIFRPRFNKQQDIYPKLLNELDSANRLFKPSKLMIYGTDILYGSKIISSLSVPTTPVVQAWQRFCNSLQMRLLLRVSKRTEMNSLARLRTMVADPVKYPIFTSNADAAILNLTGITPLVSPWGRAIDFQLFRAAGKFFLDSLNALNDPRRAKFATEARNKAGNTPIGYRGIPSGYTGSENQFDYIPSILQVGLVTAPMIVPIMPYAEVEFIKAELELKSGTSAAAKIAYEKGVKAAIEQWGVVMPADYFTNPRAAYNNTLERIMLQKYYALFFVDLQQWFERRRTGFPVLPVGPGMLNNKQLPSRFEYPLPVRTNNPVNYAEAVSWMGGDEIFTKVWWEK